MAEIFNYTNVKSDMDSIVSYKDSAKATLDEITVLLSDNINNSGVDQALGGSIGPIWNKWNAFSESFVQFSQYINSIRDLVEGGQGSASSQNQNFEATNASTIAQTESAS